MLRILVSVATYIGILNTIIIILYSHRQGRNIILSITIFFLSFRAWLHDAYAYASVAPL
jgi:hypothetical protein